MRPGYGPRDASGGDSYTPAVGEFLKNAGTLLVYLGVITAITTAPLVAWFVWVWVFRDRRS